MKFFLVLLMLFSCPSPLWASDESDLLEALAKAEESDVLDDDIESQIEDEVEDELESKLESEVESELEDDVEEELEDEFEHEVEHQLESDIAQERLHQLWDVEKELDNLDFDALPDQEIAILSAEELAQARARGLTILSEQPLPELGGVLVTFSPDKDDDSIAERAPNHVYHLDALASETEGKSAVRQAAVLGVAQALPAQQRIGMMDSAIQISHPCLQGVGIVQKNFHDPAAQPSLRHGTAIASVMAGAPGCTAAGLLTHAQLVNAVVFAHSEKGLVTANAAELVAGLDWLLQQQVQVINLSLSGPPNPVLQQALHQVHERGVQLVASVGNDGAAAYPRYPAAYPEVIAVTAVDEQQRIFARAVQGEHVELAAPGTGVQVASENGSTGVMQGTSVAAAMVSALLAAMPAAGGDEQRLQLQQHARDLGEPGRDPVFGYGLTQILQNVAE